MKYSNKFLEYAYNVLYDEVFFYVKNVSLNKKDNEAIMVKIFEKLFEKSELIMRMSRKKRKQFVLTIARDTLREFANKDIEKDTKKDSDDKKDLP